MPTKCYFACLLRLTPSGAKGYGRRCLPLSCLPAPPVVNGRGGIYSRPDKCDTLNAPDSYFFCFDFQKKVHIRYRYVYKMTAQYLT
jgi:hypothetical protein